MLEINDRCAENTSELRKIIAPTRPTMVIYVATFDLLSKWRMCCLLRSQRLIESRGQGLVNMWP